MPLSRTHFCFCSALLCPIWHYPHICMSVMSMLPFPAYTTFLSSYLISLVGCFKAHAFSLDMLKIDLKNSTTCSPCPVLFLLCSLAQGKPRLSVCLCKPWNLGLLHPWYSLFLYNSLLNPFCLTFQIFLIVCLLFYVS